MRPEPSSSNSRLPPDPVMAAAQLPAGGQISSMEFEDQRSKAVAIECSSLYFLCGATILRTLRVRARGLGTLAPAVRPDRPRRSVRMLPGHGRPVGERRWRHKRMVQQSATDYSLGRGRRSRRSAVTREQIVAAAAEVLATK